ncbi:hypothetical protein BN938_1861 [Mucinivorans hirudinis]|uniref:Fimbrillin family protein n=1 Tax=Mucinivorans hirudinis TaxID=1433126 RepID=A0A060R8R1_9BACT|nr:hypothetical protein BN938_1861 [Mucinivorans hirudinis]
MKKILMGFAALTLILSSCSKNEVADNVNSEKGLIKFSAISGALSSKAAETVLTDLQTDGVDVFALTTDDDGATYSEYFTDRLTYTTSWAPATKRFLKSGYKNEFYSIYPSQTGVTASSLATAGVGFAYTVNTNANEDLLGAAATETYAPSTDGSTGVAVVLPFNHLLSQVNLGVKNNISTLGNVVITDIQFNNVGAKGTYKFGTEGKGVDSHWTADGTQTEVYKNFTIGQGITTKTDTPDTDREDPLYKGVTGAYLPGGSGTFATDMATSSLMLMPLPFIATSTITFKFQAYDLAGTEITNGKADGTINLSAIQIDGNAHVWKQGLRYIYVVDFDSWFKNRELKFSVTLSDWENYNWGGTAGTGTGVVDITL